MRLFFALILCLLLATAIAAQEESQTPYEIALADIEQAKAEGALYLNFNGLGLTQLPPEIGQLSTLRNLQMDFNSFNSLPPEIGNLNNLEYLTTEQNALRQLPPEIGNLSNLRYLIIWDNQLESLPPEIGKLTNLEHLILAHNQLTDLPSEIGNLTNLCVLDLSYNQFNQLSSLPPELGKLENLQAEGCGIYLEGNPFNFPSSEVIAQGTPAILDYLRNQAWWHLQRLILGGAGFVSIGIIGTLGLRWRNHRRKGKKKNDL